MSGSLPYFFWKASTYFFELGVSTEVVPDQRPDAGEIALAGAPGDHRVEAEAGDGNCSPYSEYCLMKLVIWLPARFDDHEIGPRLPDLQEIGAEVGGVGGHELVGGELAAVRSP